MTEKRRTRSAQELWELEWEGGDADHTAEIVDEEIDDSWRHGNYVTSVVKETLPTGEVFYWEGTYQVSGDGEYHSWRDGDCDDFREVFPKTVVIEKVVYE